MACWPPCPPWPDSAEAKGALPELNKLLKDPDSDVRVDAKSALREIEAASRSKLVKKGN